MKKTLALLLALVMLLSVLAGCGGKTEDPKDDGGKTPAADEKKEEDKKEEEPKDDDASEEPSDEPITITLMSNCDTIGGTGEKFIELVEEACNVKIEWMLPPSSSYEDNLQLMLLDENKPDAVIMPESWLGMQVFSDACNGGVFQDISGIVGNYENIMAHTADVSWDALDIFNDGRIWGMPRSTVCRADGFAMPKGFLENLGIEYKDGDILTKDEFFDILYALTYDDPDGNGIDDTYGLSGYVTAAGDLWTCLPHIFGFSSIAAGAWREYNGKIDCINYSKELPNFKEFLEFANKCWEAGVIDPDAFSIDQPTSQDHWKSHISNCQEMYGGNMTIKEDEEDPYAVQTYIAGIVPNEGDTYGWGQFGTGIWWFWGITSQCEHPEKVLEIFDYVLSDDMHVNLNARGVEGYNFTIDENGIYDFSLNDALSDDEKNNNPIAVMVRRCDDPDFFVSKSYTKEQRDYINQCVQYSLDYYQPSLDRGYKPPIADDAVFIEYQAYMIDEINKIIAGQEPIEHWDEVLDGWYEAGGTQYYEQMIEYINSFEG